MTKRKFTPPTEFPAEYVDGYGRTVVLFARGYGRFPLLGQWMGLDDKYRPACYNEEGMSPDYTGRFELYDKPKRIKQWINVYEGYSTASYESKRYADASRLNSRICVYRIESDEDGSNPKIFVEDV